jgi:hypothetical protein
MKTLQGDIKKRLLQGETIKFDNDVDCIKNQHDDYRGGEIYYTSTNSFFHPSYVDGFKIWFNGKLIHSSKTFAPANKKLMILFEKWSLKFEE